MRELGCADVGRRLQAFHDRELSVAEQIVVRAHLDSCPRCAREAAQLAELGDVLRQTALVVDDGSAELDQLPARVIGQMKAERAAEWPARVNRAFEDLHLVWAALGATAATAACVGTMLALVYFGTVTRPDSLAALLEAMSAPGSDSNPVGVHDRMQLPRSFPGAAIPVAAVETASGEDVVFALAGVVTRDGRIVRLELLPPSEWDDRARELLSAASAARFTPAHFAGSPVAVNVVWLLARTTVRGRL